MVGIHLRAIPGSFASTSKTQALRNPNNGNKENNAFEVNVKQGDIGTR